MTFIRSIIKGVISFASLHFSESPHNTCLTRLMVLLWSIINDGLFIAGCAL